MTDKHKSENWIWNSVNVVSIKSFNIPINDKLFDQFDCKPFLVV